MAPHQESAYVRWCGDVPLPPHGEVEGRLEWCFVADDSFGLLWSPVRLFHSHDETFFIPHPRKRFQGPGRRSCRTSVLFNELRHNHFNLHVACCYAVSTIIVLLNYSFFTTILWIHINFYSYCNLITDGGKLRYYIIHEAQGSDWVIYVVSNNLKMLMSNLHHQLLCKQVF